MQKSLILGCLAVVVLVFGGCETGGAVRPKNDVETKGTLVLSTEEISKSLDLQKRYAIEALQAYDSSDLEKLALKIKKEKDVRDVYFHEESGNIDITFKNGMLGGIVAPFDRKKIKGSGQRVSAIKEVSSSRQVRALNNEPLQNRKVLSLALQYWEWGDRDDVPTITRLLENDRSFEIEKDFQDRLDGNLEVFTHLDDYGIVLLSSHGMTYKKDRKEIVLIQSNTEATPQNSERYSRYLSERSVIALTSYFDKSATKECTKDRPENCVLRTVYNVTPDFIEKYNRKFDDTLVYMSICKGAANNTMANAFLKKGASVYLGYSDNVSVSFVAVHGTNLFEKLLSLDADNTYNNIAQSFVPGIKEHDDDPAEFTKFANTNLIAIKNTKQDTGLVDGSLYYGGNGFYNDQEVPIDQYASGYEDEDTYSILVEYENDLSIDELIGLTLEVEDYSNLIQESDIDNSDLVDGSLYYGGNGFYDDQEVPINQYASGYEEEDSTSTQQPQEDTVITENIFEDYTGDFDGMSATDDYYDSFYDDGHVNISGVATGPQAYGKDLYEKKCAKCHGQYGERHALGLSRLLNTFGESELIDALYGYMNATRNLYGYGPVMKEKVDGLSYEEVMDLAEYIRTL